MLNDDGFFDNLLQKLGVGPPPEVTEQETSEVGVHTLITADQFVGEGKTGHETALLQPEDGSEGPGEEDTLDRGEGDETFAERSTVVGDVTKSPVSLPLDAGNGVDGTEEVIPTSGILDVRVDEEGVCL